MATAAIPVVSQPPFRRHCCVASIHRDRRLHTWGLCGWGSASQYRLDSAIDSIVVHDYLEEGYIRRQKAHLLPQLCQFREQIWSYDGPSGVDF